MDLLFLKILSASICIGISWTEILTIRDGILESVVKYYPSKPSFISRVLSCAICCSGWISIILSTYFFISNYGVYDISTWFCIGAMPFCSMTLTYILLKH